MKVNGTTQKDQRTKIKSHSNNRLVIESDKKTESLIEDQR